MNDKIENKPSQKLMVRRVAGERGQGAGSLYTWGYAELSEVLGVEPLVVARAVNDGQLEPLALGELALARKQGLDVLLSLPDHVHRERPTVVGEVVVAHPPTLEIVRGLETLWALTYADIAVQVGLTPNTVRGAGKGPAKALAIRSLSSVLDFVAARHPLMSHA